MAITDPIDTKYILSADIGGAHITAAICNVQTNTIMSPTLTRSALNSKSNAAEILTTWDNTLQNTIDRFQTPVSGIAMAMPGPFDYQNGVAFIKGFSKYEALFGMDIKQHLANKFNMPPSAIKFRNDAEATIAGEVLAGAGKGFQHLMGVTLGTGFGSAHFQQGEAKDLNMGSEPYRGSIADDHLSTRWFLKRYYELTGISVPGVQQLAELAYSNPVIKEIFKEFAINMSNFLMEPVYELKPEILIICGNIARASGLFLPHIKKRLNIPIALAQLGENAPLIGAAALFEPVLEKPINTL